MPFGLNFGFNKSSSSSQYNKQGSGTARPIIPAGWQANYDALGSKFGFGPSQGKAPNPNEFTPSGAWNAGTPYQGATGYIGGDQISTWGPSTAQGPTSVPAMDDRASSVPGDLSGYFGDQGAAAGALRGRLGQGFNADQSGAADIFRGRAANDPAITGLKEGAGRLGQSARALEGMWTNYADPALQQGPHLLGAAPASVADISAGRGSDFAQNYINPHERDVVGATKADMQEAFNRALSRAKMSAAAGGGLAGRGTAIGEAQTTDDYLRNLGSTLGSLRSSGWLSSQNLGMADANRGLQASLANQANARAAAEMANQRQMFDVGSRYQTDQDRRSLLGMGADWAVGAGQLGADAAQLGVQGSELQRGNAGDLFNVGGTADEQSRQNALDLFQSGQIGFDQLMAFLGLGTQQFGESEQFDESGTSKGKGKGFSFGGSVSGG